MQVHPADPGARAQGEAGPLGRYQDGCPRGRHHGPLPPQRRRRRRRARSDLATPPLAPLSWQKYDYDSSSVRKRFFREALLQITIPFLLKKLAPTCKSVSPPPRPSLLRPPEHSPLRGPRAQGGPDHPPALSLPTPPPQELPRFQELIFEDFARFILVENTYEEVVLQTVMKDILQGMAGPVLCWVGTVTARGPVDRAPERSSCKDGETGLGVGSGTRWGRRRVDLLLWALVSSQVFGTRDRLTRWLPAR